MIHVTAPDEEMRYKRGNYFNTFLGFTQKEKMAVEDRWFQGSFYLLLLLLQAAGEDMRGGWQSH